jgi:hypothetical protein
MLKKEEKTRTRPDPDDNGYDGVERLIIYTCMSQHVCVSSYKYTVTCMY